MRIGELASRAGVNASRIRFYEREGLLPPAERRANGYRTYPADAVERIMLIERAQSLGFSLAEVTAFLPPLAAPSLSCADMISLLEGKLGDIERLTRQLAERRAEIEALIGQLRDGTAAPLVGD